MIVNLLGYMPDADPAIMGVLTNVAATVPSLKGMKGAPSPVAAPMATLAATCMGAASVTKLDLTQRLFAGTATKIYETGTSTWSDVSRSAVYNTAATNRWRFAQTSNVSLAANGADTVQASISTGPFSCVAGAPVAAIVETVGAFVFAANTDAGTNVIQWAAINGYTSWASSINTQAGRDTLTASPGPITAARKFGTTIIVYKKNSMYLGVYSGPPNIWQINSNQIPGNVGAMSQEVVVNVGTPENPKHIFMGEDNFYMYDGSKPVPIGNNRINITVFNSLLQSRYYACTAQHDKKNFRIYFYYPVADSALPDHCVVYNYLVDKWGVDDRQIEATLDYVATGLTYDGVGGVYATYNSLPNSSYDSAFISSSISQPAIFDTSHVVRTLTGPTGSSSITLGDLGDDIKVLTLNRVRPRFLTAPTSAQWTPAYRMVSGASYTQDVPVSLANGAFDYMREARWHTGRMDLIGDWEAGVISLEGSEGSLE